jgi:hypothetical protein
MNGIKGYKASYNQRCLNRKFEVGRTYTLKHRPKLCKYGFHFCTDVSEVLNYYDIEDDAFVLFEINAIGMIETGRDKSCTNKIYIKRIIPRTEYHKLFNGHIQFHENGIVKYKKTGNYEYKWDENGVCIDCRYTFYDGSKTYTEIYNSELKKWIVEK